jgi:ABC-type multidrug transport system ATPase subunit
VVRDVSLEVGGGDTLLLVGHNGAGKTTLIRLLAGLLKPTKGSVTYSGVLGMVAHNSMLYDALTARENLSFYGSLYNRAAVQRSALLPDPNLLLLDEPLTGLDDAASGTVRDVLADLRAQDCAVIIATHQLVELVDLASAVGFLVAGRLVAVEPIEGRDATAVMTRYRELAANA